ncbi:lytic transglycosylase domain-containing protein [Hydrogenivirga sp. 128-5-R1-1]|uniref:lytic transglycosylase domain-containing protein n=1 Tax=Hydrogenivirga sp. 128-5-R1-1 TaxID=392423 RepID=UPI00015EF8D1|nr:lytic transglycosylase domain-containing protein [Hydrogenivirga sp. 128-5-R1-1]EDP75180.1 hypothetical protein HG1285_00410 [Hydrogenivirga sp. 128-5-R1-1]
MLGRVILLLAFASVITACTPTVKEVAIYKGKRDVVIVKKGKFLFNEEDKRFMELEARRLGIKVPDRKEVRRHLLEFLRNKRSMEVALKRANLYVPYIKPILREYGLPEELALLPLIESGYNPFAVSRSGAGGIWQLMPFTAKRYGLKVNGRVDERFDLFKSTHAAAGYLKDLYKLFGNWELVLAAYNCGEGCVKRRTGGVDFWKSKWALPEQTRKYVPMFFAALLIAKDPHRYGLKVEVADMNIEKRLLGKSVRVKDFVRGLNIKESTFRDLNPHIKGGYIPSGVHVYVPEGSPVKVVASAQKVKAKPVKKVRPVKNKLTKVVKKRAVKKVAPKPKLEKRSTKLVASAEKTSPKVKKEVSKVKKPQKKKPIVAKKMPIKKEPVKKTPVKKSVKVAVAKRNSASIVKEVEKRKATRIVIKGLGDSLERKTKVITLDNGAVLYIKE